jgi:hypothetical protein
VGTTLVGTYGTLLLGANGHYTYTLASNQANVQALSAGQVVTETFRYTLSDGQSHLVQQPGPWQNLLKFSEAFNNAAWSRFSVPGTCPPSPPMWPPIPSAVPSPPTASPSPASPTASTRMPPWRGSTLQCLDAPGQRRWPLQLQLLRWRQQQPAIRRRDRRVAALHLDLHRQWRRQRQCRPDAHFSQSATGVFEVWGAQLNAGATAQNYLATTSAPVTITNPAPTEAVIASTLTISIHGATDPGLLSFDASERGVVADLTTHEWSHPITIMPFGDSITYGWRPQDDLGQSGESNGYRNPLWWNFAAQHMLIDFIGSRRLRLLQTSETPIMPDFPVSERSARLRVSGHDAGPAGYSGPTGSGCHPADGWHQRCHAGSAPQNTVGQEMRNILNAISQAARSSTSMSRPCRRLPRARGSGARSVSVNSAITTTVQQAIAAGINVSLVSMSNITLWTTSMTASIPMMPATPRWQRTGSMPSSRRSRRRRNAWRNCACHRSQGARCGGQSLQ